MMGADETKSDTPESTLDPAFEQEVMRTLLDPSERSVDEIDELAAALPGAVERARRAGALKAARDNGGAADR